MYREDSSTAEDRYASYPPEQHFDERVGLYKDECYQIVGAAIDVLNGMGASLPEEAYINALAHEFTLRDIPFELKPVYDILYKGEKVSEFAPEFVVYDTIIVEPRVIPRIESLDVSRNVNALKICDLPLSVLLNFKYPKLQWKRVIN